MNLSSKGEFQLSGIKKKLKRIAVRSKSLTRNATKLKMALDMFTISEKKLGIIKMDEKLCQNHIFQSNFDLFEFDDGFLSKVDSEVKKQNVCLKNNVEAPNELISEPGDNFLGCGKKDLKNKNYYDLPVSIEDFNESDFKDPFIEVNNKVSLKVSDCSTAKKKGNDVSSCDFLSCLSPIRGEFLSKDRNSSFSSTPLRDKSSGEVLKSKQTEPVRGSQKEVVSGSEFEGLELDLFEEWDLDDVHSCEVQKKRESGITLSQAVNLIEEAKLAKESEELSQGEASSNSINLLTGEVVGDSKRGNFDNLFGESFDLAKFESDEKRKAPPGFDKSISLPLESKSAKKSDSEIKSKPPAAQKLNFESKNETVRECKVTTEKENGCADFENIYFSSDDDFDMFSQFDEPNKLTKLNLSVQISRDQVTKNNNNDSVKTPVRGDNFTVEPDDSSFHFGKKRKKHFNVIESDTAEESPSPKFFRRNNKKSKTCNKKSEVTSGVEFIDLEAEVSEDDVVSSDEKDSDKDDEYDGSFVDEESYFTQNYSADMTAKYLESAKVSNNRPGTFKIPEMKPYDPADICSQFQPNTSTEYEIDSFCVNDVENEETDLSELEIAEQILEMDRKNRKKKSGAPRSRRGN